MAKMTKKQKTSIIPKSNSDNFRNFQGFAPEYDYESFSREDPATVARGILKNYKGKKVELTYYPVSRDGVTERYEELVVPMDDASIDKLLEHVKTDHIKIEFLYDHDVLDDDEILYYTIQRIVIGDQSVSQIERL